MANFFEDIVKQFNIAKPQQFITPETPIIKKATELKVGTDNFFKPIVDKFISSAGKITDVAIKATAPLSVIPGAIATKYLATEKEKEELGKMPFFGEFIGEKLKELPFIGKIPLISTLGFLGTEALISGIGGEKKALTKLTDEAKKFLEDIKKIETFKNIDLDKALQFAEKASLKAGKEKIEIQELAEGIQYFDKRANAPIGENLKRFEDVMRTETSKIAPERGFYVNEFDATGNLKFVPAEKAKIVEISPNIETFISRGREGGWRISEGKTGTLIAEKKTQKEAIERASEIIKSRKDTIETAIAKAIEKGGISPRYKGIEPTVTPKVDIITKELQPLAQEARKYKSAEEFEQSLIKGNSFQEVQNKFRTITGESKYSGSKAGIKTGEAQGESFARMPTKQEITDFYNQVTKGVTEKIPPSILKEETKISSLISGEKPPIEPPVKSSYNEILPPEGSLVNRVIQALKEAKPIRAEQEKLYTAERAKRFGKAEAVGEKIKGEAGFRAELSQLKGEMPKAQFESLRSKLSQEDVDNLFQMVAENPWLKFTDTLSARTGLTKMIEGSVPTNSELELLNKVFPPEMMKGLLDKRPLLQKIKDIGLELANLPRSFMSSVDLSFGGRQGIFAAPTFRKEFWSSWKSQFKIFGSEKAYNELMTNITKEPYFNLAKESGISFTNIASAIGQREERFASSWGDRIPLIKQSGRAYTGFANKFRMDIFSSIAKDIEATGVKLADNPEMAKELGSLVNAMTGRGDLPKVLSHAAPALNAFFFSPRLMASRIRLLTDPNIYITSSPQIRKQAWKSLIGFTGYVMTTLTLAKLAGAEIGTDPRSSDFAKIKIGDTRIDIMGGFQQYIRMASQLISGKYVSSVTGKEITLGEGYKPLTRFDILQRQIESKEAPIFSFITSLLKGQDYKGEPLNIPMEVGQRFVPMVVQDIYDLAKNDPKLLPLGVLGIFGLGLQTYEPQKPFSKGIGSKGVSGKGIKSQTGIGK